MKKFQPLEKMNRKVPILGKTAPPEASPHRQMLSFKVGRTLRVSRLFHSTSHILLSTVIFSFFLSGCAVFQPRTFVEMERAPQASLPAPQSFQAVQSVVFSFYGRKMTGIGVISLNRSDRTFELSCMTPMGTKLFDLRYANETPEVVFALPFFTEKGDFAEAVALDIARMYFDPEPPRISRAWRKGDTLTIESEDDSQSIEYDYQGTPPVLMEKRFRRDRALEAVINYSKFFEQDGFRCIGEASLKSKLYGYRLTVRTKKLTIHPERIAK